MLGINLGQLVSCFFLVCNIFSCAVAYGLLVLKEQDDADLQAQINKMQQVWPLHAIARLFERLGFSSSTFQNGWVLHVHMPCMRGCKGLCPEYLTLFRAAIKLALRVKNKARAVHFTGI